MESKSSEYINKRINARDEKHRRRQLETKHAKIKYAERPRQHLSFS